ncbi:MAG: flavodoxin family protein, partial [Desulfomonilia bacterium]|nr:flavodoxin family protein [Desulfomonilia bacterium]
SRLAGQGRTAVVSAVCEQADSYDMGFTLEAMRRPLEALGYDVIGELPVFGIFEKGGVRERTDLLEAAEKLGAELSEAIIR